MQMNVSGEVLSFPKQLSIYYTEYAIEQKILVRALWVSDEVINLIKNDPQRVRIMVG